jgi:hypothetical protein
MSGKWRIVSNEEHGLPLAQAIFGYVFSTTRKDWDTESLTSNRWSRMTKSYLLMNVEKRRATTTPLQVIRLNRYGGMWGVHLAIPIVEGVT